MPCITGHGPAQNLGKTQWDTRPSEGFFSPAAEETALDDFDHECRSLFLAHLRIKPASVENK